MGKFISFSNSLAIFRVIIASVLSITCTKILQNYLIRRQSMNDEKIFFPFIFSDVQRYQIMKTQKKQILTKSHINHHRTIIAFIANLINNLSWNIIWRTVRVWLLWTKKLQNIIFRRIIIVFHACLSINKCSWISVWLIVKFMAIKLGFIQAKRIISKKHFLNRC